MSAFVLVLGDGARLHVRPIEPADKGAILDGFDRLGAVGRELDVELEAPCCGK